MIVYLLTHIRIEEEDEDMKVCGIYYSEQAAQSAIKRLVIEAGFNRFPSGFHISAYQLNKDHWIEGFGGE